MKKLWIAPFAAVTAALPVAPTAKRTGARVERRMSKVREKLSLPKNPQDIAVLGEVDHRVVPHYDPPVRPVKASLTPGILAMYARSPR